MCMEWVIYVLTVLSVTVTAMGIVFAIYGWWNTSRAERIVEAKMAVYAKKIEGQLENRMIQAQDALHKIVASYALSAAGNHEGAISLLEAAVSADPDAFNGYSALGYEYWKIGRMQEAVECFVEAKERFPGRIEPYNDLARLYAKMDEPALALKYLEGLLNRAPHEVQTIEQDPIFAQLRDEFPGEYEKIINMAKSK